ncbi:MAG: class I SAM-dependent methyltransferase [Clostridiales bacterium]|jgi:ubiquinone/menaquinone biosynthesis C-methylase UbiE|nr:class I SAM-dependent methyltransferase [Clostridiales bacterium]
MSVMSELHNPNDNWKKFLTNTSETNINYKNIRTLKDLSPKMVADYTFKTLDVLDSLTTEKSDVIDMVRTTLQWCEVAKCGSKDDRNRWIAQGYDLHAHNYGSADIYKENTTDFNEIIYTLIKTHGLLGQHHIGEVNFDKNKELYDLVKDGKITAADLKKALTLLNYCILDGLQKGLFNSEKSELNRNIDKIIAGDFAEENFYDKNYIITRFKKLRQNAPTADYQPLRQMLDNPDVRKAIGDIFKNNELWYFYGGLNDFTPEETGKIFLLISAKTDLNSVTHITFENFMKNIYRDYNGEKVPDLFKKRIIESYLKDLKIDDLLAKRVPSSKHIIGSGMQKGDTFEFEVEFSTPAQKLIDFCEVAYEDDQTYSEAVVMLYKLFGFSRDAYDRFYNEKQYLNRMNSSMPNKAKLLDYVTGDKVLDIGPGGGALMDLIQEQMPDAEVYGIDISQNVIESLNAKKDKEHKKWNVVKGNALKLDDHFKPGAVDTIVYSSIIHELFSYIDTDGKKFNHETIRQAIDSAYNVLPDNGRIVIRDGIMTEPADQDRIIEFKTPEGKEFLDAYCKNFKGRDITYQNLGDNKVKMKVNDAMEFLYTYTWGKNSFAHEVQEQFGYFTPTEYVNFFKENFKDKFNIVECKHFLQDGYEENLLPLINFYDGDGKPARLPDSTCIIVAEVDGRARALQRAQNTKAQNTSPVATSTVIT